MRSVKFIDLTKVVSLVQDSAYSDWRGILDGKGFIQGKHTAILEQKLSSALGVKHVIACANGTDAIGLALMAAGIGRDDIVAVPNLTFWASCEAPALLGCRLLLLDVGSDLHFSLGTLRRAAAEHKIRACILPNLFGWAAADLDGIRSFCNEAGITLIEDDAQAYGVTVSGRPVFADARISTLSFYPAKVIGGCMDGGAVMTDDDALAARLRSLANHGRAEHYSYAHVGVNSRMAELNAAFLSRMIDHAGEIVAGRAAAFARYERRLSGIPGLTFHRPPAGQGGNGYLTMLTHDRIPAGEMVARLKDRGVFCGRVYPETMDMQPPGRDWIRFGSLEVSRDLCNRVFSLPLYYGIAEEDIDYVCDTLIEVIRPD